MRLSGHICFGFVPIVSAKPVLTFAAPIALSNTNLEGAIDEGGALSMLNCLKSNVPFLSPFQISYVSLDEGYDERRYCHTENNKLGSYVYSMVIG